MPLKYDARLTVWFTIGRINFIFYPFWISSTVYIIIHYGTRDLWKSFWAWIIKIKKPPDWGHKGKHNIYKFSTGPVHRKSHLGEIRFIQLLYTKLLAAFFSQHLLEKSQKWISLRFSIKLWIKRRNWPKKNC